MRLALERIESIESRLRDPMLEFRFLLERGYRRSHALGAVSEHHQLTVQDRNVLERVIFPAAEAERRRAKLVGEGELRGQDVAVDGYNVLIGVECLLAGQPLLLCDDGFVRDVAAVRGAHTPGDRSEQALDLVCEAFSRHGAKSVRLVFDEQVSRSGEVAGLCRHLLERHALAGDAFTERHADQDLRLEGSRAIVCSSDRAIIDAVDRAHDVVAGLARGRVRLLEPPSAALLSLPG